jgi:hypothetical protein
MTVYDHGPCPWLLTVQYRFKTEKQAQEYMRHLRNTDEFIETIDVKFEREED